MNETQIDRYKKLVSFIEAHFKEDIQIPQLEAACHYSYRNINRIFEALQQETIGQYIKRRRLELAAQYLRYSEESISEIAMDVGFGGVAAFSKAFRSRFGCSPRAFRKDSLSVHLEEWKAEGQLAELEPISFETEVLPDMYVLGLEYHGPYDDFEGIKATWEKFLTYVDQQDLIRPNSIFLAEILDDEDITDKINCRYNVALVLEKPLPAAPQGLFQVKRLPGQRYAKFMHQGPHEASSETYQRIFGSWLEGIQLEWDDGPILEFYLNDEEDTAPADLLTEIYIPVQ